MTIVQYKPGFFLWLFQLLFWTKHEKEEAPLDYCSAANADNVRCAAIEDSRCDGRLCIRHCYEFCGDKCDLRRDCSLLDTCSMTVIDNVRCAALEDGRCDGRLCIRHCRDFCDDKCALHRASSPAEPANAANSEETP